EVDFRSDVYALGATFYHYLAGRAPYDGDSPTQIMLKHVTSPLVPIRSINPDVPMEFDDIIRKCMAKDPNDRYQDYADLVSDLSHVKLQWMARERGSIINSIHGLPGVGNDTFPPPPGASAVANRRPSSARQPVVLHEEHEEKVPLWRFALIAGAVLVIVGIGALMVFGPKKEQTSSPQSQATAATVAALLERFMAPPPASGGGPTPPPPHPDLVRYQYTRAILDDLGRGLATYYAAKGEYPPRLGVLIQEGYTVEPYVQSGNGTPIDGWDNLLLYSATSGTIRSGGMDGDMRTPDDLVVDPESGLLIEDISAYEALD
ncbi:MAG: hypothetical protein KF858_13715, partial [Candidatus Sumerlaeia bacterium]|nr:hypothetical protein [Candidatus Sumerlaeia bacterium]